MNEDNLKKNFLSHSQFFVPFRILWNFFFFKLKNFYRAKTNCEIKNKRTAGTAALSKQELWM